MSQQHIITLNTFGLLGITIVLLMGSILQISLNELPCPLCLLQRLGFVMVMFGFMLNVVYGTAPSHYGITLVGALFGAVSALRQVSLHVIPGTLGFGSPVFGMHYYTWAFIIFSMTIFGVSILLIIWNKELSLETYYIGKFGRAVCILAIYAVFLNAISTFIECGPFECPADPVSYWLLDILR
ncbi:disulfide bond formation protein B [Vibrio sp. BS-M-Sm-2]|uniref:disulfide bond formation protein B n=1 Tax=Vibrio sp. BS-M-Sm-2 TaxID=3241167 RepID=UPI003558507F